MIKSKRIVVPVLQYKDGSVAEPIQNGNPSSHCRAFAQKYHVALAKFASLVKMNKDDFHRLMIDTYEALNESLDGTEKFNDLVKFLDTQQLQVSSGRTIEIGLPLYTFV
jgi:hypothetical protein